MRTEVHVHGYLELVEGITRRQVEGALRPLLQYLDAEHLKEVQSLEPDQPGFAFDERNYSLEMCCTLEVGRNFLPSLEQAMQALGKLVETASAIEIITYHEEEDRDETQLMFVGPTPAAILDAQRRYMLEDVGALLSRHFKQPAVDEVLALVSDLFRREQNTGKPASEETVDEFSALQMPHTPGRHRLH